MNNLYNNFKIINKNLEECNADEVKRIFYEILKDVEKQGFTLSVPDERIGVSNYYLDLPMEKIKSQLNDCFFKWLETYINAMGRSHIVLDETNIKYLIVKLLLRAESSDLGNMLKFIVTQLKFLSNPLDNAVYNLFDYKLRIINKKTIGYESINSLGVSISDGTNKFNLPDIFYGIADDTCYIYAIQNLEKSNNPLQKQMNRVFYKFNSNVNDEYYLGHNIKNVTMSFLFSIFIFMYQLSLSGISKIKVTPPLPLFVYNKIHQTNERTLLAKDENELNNLNQKLNTILNNIGEKYFNTFFRLSYHFPNICIQSFNENGINVELMPFLLETNNSLFNEIIRALNQSNNVTNEPKSSK